METLDKPDDNELDKTDNTVNGLPLQKQFTHATFCQQIKTISPEDAKKLLEELHLLYLNQGNLFNLMARDEFKQ